MYAGPWLSESVEECYPSLKIGNIDFNEDIDNYWSALDTSDRKWSITEERYMRDYLGGKLLTDD